MVIKSSLVIILCTLLLGGCSSGDRKERAAFREVYKIGNYSEALSKLKNSKFYKDESSELLNIVEEALLYHSWGKYLKSIELFEKANKIADRLYTQKISSSIKSAVVNDNEDDYEGAVFERSLIYFYQSLNYFLITQRGHTLPTSIINEKGEETQLPSRHLDNAEKKRYLRAARAEILAWDTFWKNYRNSETNDSVFKHDLLGKLYGGYIHEAMEIRSDLQISLILYKDALNLLEKNYNAYEAFNRKYKTYKTQGPKKLANKKLWKEHVDFTDHYSNLQSLIHYKILKLTKQLRPRTYASEVKKLNPSKEVLNKLKYRNSDNIGILFQGGLVSPLFGDEYNISLQGLAKNSKDSKTAQAVMRIGVDVLGYFMAHTLGLMPKNEGWAGPKGYLGYNVGRVGAALVGIDFEMPAVKKIPVKNDIILKIKSSEGKIVYTNSMALINPLGDIAQELIAERSASRFIKTGVRVGLKHLSAIVAAYGTYQAMKDRQGDFLARTAAIAGYALATRGIAASEKADIRFWSILPNEIRMDQFYLPPGKYSGEIVSDNSEKWTIGDFEVKKGERPLLLNYRKTML